MACLLKPSLAHYYQLERPSLSERLIGVILFVLPTGIIIFLVVGLIFLGITTPSESAASGTMGMLLVLAFYKKLNWKVIKKSIAGTLNITGMIFIIIAGSQAFNQILSFSGATQGMIEFATGLDMRPIWMIIAMRMIILIMGGFMEPVVSMMITLPVLIPIIKPLGSMTSGSGQSSFLTLKWPWSRPL
jgi:TRAP-type mannitol/chloroaromatic compound transport system permease large subunit